MRPKYTGNNVRGKITIPDHAHPLVRRLIAEMNEQQTTFAEVSARSNVGVDTIRFWAGRHMPRLDTFEAALNVLGYELKIVEQRLTSVISQQYVRGKRNGFQPRTKIIRNLRTAKPYRGKEWME